ncbi:MAG: hypothetical protein IKZ67_05625, partial [Paludibacteraceae bacterium]|nr:hypothetical protein [Paludibacteraceae bacterium]
RGFIFAMLVGVIVGTYSSWFIAAPIAHKFLPKKDAEFVNANGKVDNSKNTDVAVK